MSEPSRWDLNRGAALDAAIVPADPAVIDAARRVVVQRRPDDFPELLDMLGIP